jgi:pilus assembly protein Flp/PilA
MREYVKTWLALSTDKRAVTALEYGLIAAVIAGVVIAGFTALGTSISGTLTTLKAAFPA